MNRLLPFGLILMLAGNAFGTITNVFTGTATNDGTGDPIRTAFNKLNTNDVYLVSYFTNQVSSMLSSNGWMGPSNSLDVLLGKQYYKTLTPFAVTGIANIPAATMSARAELTVSNASSTNVTFTILSGIRTVSGLKSWTLTNSDVLRFSLETADGMTNGQTLYFY